jgi:hypothetical protein
MFNLSNNEGAYDALVGAYNAIGEQLEIYQNVRDLTEMLVQYLREKDPNIQKQIADNMKFPDTATWMLYKLHAYGDGRVQASWRFHEYDPRGKWMNYKPDDMNFTIEI